MLFQFVEKCFLRWKNRCISKFLHCRVESISYVRNVQVYKYKTVYKTVCKQYVYKLYTILYTKLTHEGKILLSVLFSIASRIDQGCTDWCKIERPEIALNFLRHSSKLNMIFYHVFVLDPILFRLLCSI